MAVLTGDASQLAADLGGLGTAGACAVELLR